MKVLVILALFGCAVALPRSTKEVGPPCPLEDPLHRPEQGPLNITLDPIAAIFEGGIRSEVHVEGLMTFNYEFTINMVTLVVPFTVNLANLDLTSAYTAEGYLDVRPFSEGCIPSGNFTGTGTAVVTASTLLVQGTATLFINLINNRISIRTLVLPVISFAAANINLGSGYAIDGAPIDWDAFNANFKSCFETELAANRPAVVEKIRITVNFRIAHLSLDELLDQLLNPPPEGCTYF